MVQLAIKGRTRLLYLSSKLRTPLVCCLLPLLLFSNFMLSSLPSFFRFRYVVVFMSFSYGYPAVSYDVYYLLLHFNIFSP